MEKKQNDQSTITENADINTGLIKNVKVHTNLAQDVIITTEDKIRICLMNCLGKMGKKSAWIAPAGILLTIILTLLTTEFKNFFLPADTWIAVFTIAAALSFLWLIFCIRDAFRSVEIDDVIDELKKGSLKKDKGHIIYFKNDNTIIEVDQSESEKNSTLEIENATYGIPDQKVDITPKIKSLVKDNKLIIDATNALVDKDPVPGTKKFLEIEYEYQGNKFSKSYKENESVNLP